MRMSMRVINVYVYVCTYAHARTLIISITISSAIAIMNTILDASRIPTSPSRNDAQHSCREKGRGKALGSFLCHLGSSLEASWAASGLSWSHWGLLGAILRALGALWELSWGPLGALWGSRGAILGPSWGSWGPLGAILEDIDQRRGGPLTAAPL